MSRLLITLLRCEDCYNRQADASCGVARVDSGMMQEEGEEDEELGAGQVRGAGRALCALSTSGEGRGTGLGQGQ